MATTVKKTIKKTSSTKKTSAVKAAPKKVVKKTTPKKVKKVSVKKETKKIVTKPKATKSTTKSPDIKYPSLQEMLEAGAHFGHKTSRWYPRMEKYIFDTRNGIHIIDLTQTLELLKDAVDFLAKASEKGNILLVGTKGQAATLTKNAGMDHGAFYISRRWPGGLLTNYKNIKKSINKLMEIEESLAAGTGFETKKERLVMERKRDKLKKLYEGIVFIDKEPSAMVVIDTKIEKNAIREARVKGIKVVGLIDTNCDPNLVDYPIPANDDAIRSISLFLDVLVQSFSRSKTSIELASKRNDYVTKLDRMRRESELEAERIKKEEQLGIQRLKEMKSDSGKIVRVVRKKPDKPIKVVKKSTRKKETK
jgi:small subunit ribosomal protein S2